MEMKIQTVHWERSRIPLLYPAFQRGVLIRVRLGGDIRSLLCDQLGLDPDYVAKRIQTAFLNGKPVDDFDEATVGEGAVLTLSGALPGLAGATLRKGGFYSSMRASVSYAKGAEREEEQEGFITVRVFNILLRELAPALLAYGIFFPEREFLSLSEELKPADRTAYLRNGAGADKEAQERRGDIFIRVQSQG
jgi:hypothetical protein